MTKNTKTLLWVGAAAAALYYLSKQNSSMPTASNAGGQGCPSQNIACTVANAVTGLTQAFSA